MSTIIPLPAWEVVSPTIEEEGFDWDDDEQT